MFLHRLCVMVTFTHAQKFGIITMLKKTNQLYSRA